MAALVARPECFIAADVGGTHARVALVEAAGDRTVEVRAYRKYQCAEFPSLTAILSDFIDGRRAGGERMAIASAGVLHDGELVNSNLPWPVSLADMRRELGLRELRVINDFAAAAHGVGQMAATDLRLLTPGVDGDVAGPMLVIGPGTGLGAAISVAGAHGRLVLASEACMAAFAPVTAREIEILRWMQRRHGAHVAIEQLLSGPGLVNLHEAIAALEGATVQSASPAAVADAARRGDAIAREAVLAFCALLGSVIGDLAVTSCAVGVHVAGGVVPRLADFLPHSEFHARMVDKGTMRPLLERMPVWLIENERLGVLGAASWYRQYLGGHPSDTAARRERVGNA